MVEGWSEVALGDICRAVMNRRGAAHVGGVPYVGLEHMPSGSPRITQCGTAAGLASQVVAFEPGDILFGRLRPYLMKVAWADFAGVCSPEILVLRPTTGSVLPGYLYALTASKSVIDWAVSASAGSRMPRTAASDLLRFRVFLPPLPEQARIVDLSGWMDEARSRASFHEVAAHELVISLRNDLISNAQVPRRRLGDLLENIDSGVSPITEGRTPVRGEPAVLKLSAVRPGRFRPEEAKALPDGVEMPESALVRVGDVLITRSNTPDTVGFVCLVDRVGPKTYLSDLILRLHPTSDLLPRYLAEALLTDDARGQIVGSARGTSGSMRKISRATLRELEIPVPESIAYQVAAVAPLVAAAEVRESAHDVAARLADVRGIVLTELLAGIREVPTSYDRFLGGAA